MEYVIGILLLVSFFGLVVYAVRGGNLMLGIFVMGIIWTVLPMIGNMFVTNPDFIAANKDAIRRMGTCTGKCSVWCMVWTSSYENRNCIHINSYHNRIRW